MTEARARSSRACASSMSISAPEAPLGAEQRQRGLDVDARVARAEVQRMRLGRRQARLEARRRRAGPRPARTGPARRGPRCRRRGSAARRPPCRARRSRWRRRRRPRDRTGLRSWRADYGASGVGRSVVRYASQGISVAPGRWTHSHSCPPLELGALIRDGELSAHEVVEAALRRIEALDPQIGAFVEFDAERALAEARGDRARTTGARSPASRSRSRRTRPSPGCAWTSLALPRRPPAEPRRLPGAAAARRRLRDRRHDEHAGVRDPPDHRAAPRRADAQPVGHVAHAGRLVAAARRRRWRPAWCRSRTATTAAARSASPRRAAGWSGLKPSRGRISRGPGPRRLVPGLRRRAHAHGTETALLLDVLAGYEAGRRHVGAAAGRAVHARDAARPRAAARRDVAREPARRRRRARGRARAALGGDAAARARPRGRRRRRRRCRRRRLARHLPAGLRPRRSRSGSGSASGSRAARPTRTRSSRCRARCSSSARALPRDRATWPRSRSSSCSRAARSRSSPTTTCC